MSPPHPCAYRRTFFLSLPVNGLYSDATRFYNPSLVFNVSHSVDVEGEAGPRSRRRL